MTVEGLSPPRYQLGLVVGKFAPLHLGHEWLIAQAAAQCKRLLILSYTEPEFMHCEVPMRRRWLAQRFPQHETLVLDDDWLQQACKARGIQPQVMPRNEEDDATQQQFLAWLLRDVMRRKPEVLFCSEIYGPPTAAVLSEALGQDVRAVVVDVHRHHRPISASQIRRDPHAHSRWMAPEVRAAFVSRVVLFGGESSGKTSLAKALAEHFETSWVAEYGRELWEQQGGVLSEADLLRIGHEQVRREEAESQNANRFLFCDTSPLTTFGYSHWMFGRADAELMSLAERSYDRVILCRPDFPFVQDGTRRDDAFRLDQHEWYRQRLAELAVPVLEVGGGLRQRVASVSSWLIDSYTYSTGV